MESLVRAVREYAQANYNKDGWDVLVECWDDSDIAREIGTAKTATAAIKACRRAVKGMDEYRSEIQSTAF